MTSRPPVTARRARIAAELRRLRERAGLTSTEAAQRLGTSSGQLSNVERARFGVSPDRVRAMARTYGCTDQPYVDALAAMAGERTKGWWEEYRGTLPPGLLDLAELEHHATALRTAYTTHIPGLLQTLDHAREIFGQMLPVAPPSEVEQRASHRIRRQAVLHGPRPIPYNTIIHEAALRMKVGGPEVARTQLRHVLDMSERPHISVLVIPFDVGAFPGAGQSVHFVCGPVPQLDTVHLDQSHGPVLLDAPSELEEYRLLLARMEAVALGPEKSRDLIHHIARHL
ncbi:helix-turn-helix domain-containing protein [Streptomyces sudanensis]|uniref:helix-turn-helix domain-containing protein n=1 Tax=Streptomyces sudanensis TaxID=436397 RepID=UPI0020CF59F9|nr:helix-turn-helix transcriptional regulator [Streptomyces sudanensis]MCP9958339.1 helix-turn-helix domain-containing protein [Streptomyces sudanensis]MCQ0001144.1 helix-turn-helix domain-containing protein [Streptomyces sudanensis]